MHSHKSRKHHSAREDDIIVECEIEEPAPCCVKTAPSVTSNYTPKGHLVIGNVEGSEDLQIYEAPYDKHNKPNILLICAYDIFGYHNNTKEVADNIAISTGFRVIMPDFYRGDYWSESRSIQLMYSWVTYHGSWDKTKADIENIITHYKDNEEITNVGIFGFCWGGKISVLAGAQIDDVNCAGLIHPSGVELGEANNIQCPVIILPSRDEVDFLPFKEAVVAKHGEDWSEHHRFDDMPHGFAAARGDFANKENRKAVDAVIKHLSRFFTKHLA